MARQQVYRGNPETKQSAIFDNFSGGINTTDIDEQMLTNEFRLLKNVELSERGRVQNRKGFAYNRVFNEWLESGIYTSSIPEHTYLFYPVIDRFNTFDSLKDYEDFNDFKEKNINKDVDMSFLVVYRHKDNPSAKSRVWFREIRFKHVKGTSNFTGGFLSYATTIAVDDDSFFVEPNLTGLNVETYDGRYYILLNNIHEELEGYLEFYFDDEKDSITKKVYNKNNSYVPNPYEVSNIGFNLMTENPTQHIRGDLSSLTEIRSVFLTAVSNDKLVLSKIPVSGEFVLNVIYRGVPELIDQLRIRSYIEDDFGEKVYINTDVKVISNDEISGILRYKLKIDVGDNPDVFLFLDKVALNELLPHQHSFNTIEEAVDYYKNTDKSYVIKNKEYTRDYYIPDPNNIYSYKIKENTVHTITIGHGHEKNVTAFYENTPFVTKHHESVVAGGFRFYENRPDLADRFVAAIVLDFSVSPSKFVLGTFYVDNNGVFKADIPMSPFDSIYHELEQLGVDNYGTSIDDYMVKQINTVQITNTPVGEQPDPINYRYYRYNNGIEGTVDDFTEIPFNLEVEVLSFTSLYEVGVSTDKEIESIDFKGSKHKIIKDRMFVYSGNTIVVSDSYSMLDDKSFSYFPNFNYIILNLDAKDSIQTINYFRGSYLIFTKQKIFRMSGTFADGASFNNNNSLEIVMINDTIGCISPNSVRSINNTLIFLSRDGLYTVKQNYYQDGIENLEKIDRQVSSLIPLGFNYESILYNEQYMLFVKDSDGKYIKTVKQYYNMQYATKTYPYVVDEYTHAPNLLFKSGINLNAIKDGKLWIYDIGYTDFKPELTTGVEIHDYLYKWTVITPYWTVGYPLHEKKFKTFFTKLDSDSGVITPIYFTIYIDKAAFSTSYNYVAELDENGSVVYYRILNPSELSTNEDNSKIMVEEIPTQLNVDPDLVLGTFDIGKGRLKETQYQVHKIDIGGKGKSISLQIEQKKNSYIALDSIGIVFKLGKMRESR